MTRFMLATLVALAISASAQAEVKLSNLVLRWGPEGPPRPDVAFLPGQMIHFTVDVAGLEADADGHLDLRVALGVSDSAGATLFYATAPASRTSFFRSNTARLTAHVGLPKGLPSGEYTVKVALRLPTMLKDCGATECKFRVATDDFRVFAAGFCMDAGQLDSANRPPPLPAVAHCGQQVVFRVDVAGFSHESDKIAVDAEFWVTEGEQGQPLRPPQRVPVEMSYRPDTDAVYACTTIFSPPPGKFVCHARVVDRATKKVSEVALPFLVVDDLAIFGAKGEAAAKAP